MNESNGRNNGIHILRKRLCIISLMIIAMLLLGGWGLFTKKIPEAMGKDEAVLKTELEELKKDIVFQYDTEFNENVAKGLVSRTEPASGTKVTKGMTVTIFISRGKPVTISDFTNTNIETVKGILASQGLNFDCTSSYSEEIDKDNVISIDPAVGSVVEEGTMVNLLVSKGSEYRTLPRYEKMTGNEFAKKLEELGVKYNETSDFSSEVESGFVVSCNFNQGDKVSIENDTIEFVTSKGVGVTVPELIGLTQENAKSTLESLGLGCNISENYSEKKKGTVVESNKKEGAIVEEGEIITLVVSKGTAEQEFKDDCTTPSYDDLIRNPNKYQSIRIKIRARVSKIENDTLLGFKYGETIWGTYQGSEIVITDDRANKEPGFRAGDTVTIYGYGNGTSTVNVKKKEYQGSVLIGFSYNKTVDSYDIPNIKVKYVDF